MDHKTFLAHMPPEEVSRLNTRSTLAGLVHLAGHLGLIAITGMWITQGLPLWWAVLPVHGVFVIFLFTLEHEATHRTPFAQDWMSDWVGRACGVILFLPFEWFRWLHMAHHRYTHIPGKDPELAGGKAHMERWGPFLWKVSGIPYWIEAAQTMRRILRDDYEDFVPPRARQRVQREVVWMLGVYLLAVLSLILTPFLFWVWLVPIVLGQPFLRLYLMAEHGRCRHVADMLDNTRTTFTTRFLRFLAWNMPYHTEHHVMPSVPFHQLPDLHQHIGPYLRHTSNGYAEFTGGTLRKL